MCYWKQNIVNKVGWSATTDYRYARYMKTKACYFLLFDYLDYATAPSLLKNSSYFVHVGNARKTYFSKATEMKCMPIYMKLGGNLFSGLNWELVSMKLVFLEEKKGD